MSENDCSSPQLTPMGTSNVADYILLSISKYKDRVAQVDSVTNESMTYSEIVGWVIKLERKLTESGIKKGDVVVIMSKNMIHISWIVLGSVATRAACAFFNPASTTRELQHFLNIVKPKIVIAPELSSAQFSVLNEEKSVKFIYTNYQDSCSEKIVSFKNLTSETSPGTCGTLKHKVLFTPTLHDPAFLLMSSGTTGLPKVVLLEHRNIIAALEHSGLCMRHDGVALGLMPFHHAYGLGLMLMSLCEGSKMVVVPKFSMGSFLKTITYYRITHLYLIPSIYISLGKLKEVKESHFLSVREIITGAGPISWEQQSLLKKKLPSSTRIFHCYGLTETTFVILFGEVREDKPGSMGTLISGVKAKIVKVNGDLANDGEVGELLVRGQVVFSKYLDNPVATEESLDKLRWLHTGDLVIKDQDGYYFHVERKKQFIKYQGYQISPSEIELLLLQHDSVEDVAVVGIPHDIYGEVPRAFVVKRNGHDVTDDDIMKLVEDELSPYKRLRGGVQFVDVIPKTGSGKVKRGLLKEMYMKDDTYF